MAGGETVKMNTLAALCVTGLVLSAAHTATDAQSYPSRPIRFIVPYVPGGGADIVARVTAQKLTDAFGVPVVVDNRAGAGGNLGTALVARAAPDGYTLLMGNVGPIAINISLYKSLPYDPIRDLSPVSLLAVYPNVLVIHPSLPAKTVPELIAYAKARPGQVSYASAGSGSSTHLAAELFRSMAGIEMTHIPYKGGAQALVDVIGGQVQMYFSSVLGALPHIRGGRLRALAVTSARRTRVAPDLPTFAESGFSGYEANNWLGMLVPAGTPAPIVTRLNQEVVRIFQQPDVQEKLSAQGGDAEAGSPAQFAEYIRVEMKKWAKVVKDSGARAD